MSNGSWDYSVFWLEAMKQIEEEISEQEYSMWFNRMEYAFAERQEIHVAVPSSFYRDQVKQRYLPLIEEKLHELSGSSITLEFDVSKSNGRQGDNGSAAPTPVADTPVAEAPKVTVTKTKSNPAPPRKRPHGTLREEYTFDNFVIGQNNSFAANAAMAIAKNPGTGYNPCLIYGGVGLGKTHLIQSIGNSVHTEFDNLKVVYVTMETFTNDFIQSIREKKTQAFKNKYRYADVLLLDDIHFLQKKPETQEELFHTFNALYEANKQMVFTCDRPVSRSATSPTGSAAASSAASTSISSRPPTRRATQSSRRRSTAPASRFPKRSLSSSATTSPPMSATSRRRLPSSLPTRTSSTRTFPSRLPSSSSKTSLPHQSRTTLPLTSSNASLPTTSASRARSSKGRSAPRSLPSRGSSPCTLFGK